MTPEELTEARKTIGSDCQESDLVCAIQEAGQSLLAHIDQQAKQIEALNEKLIEAKAKEIYPFNIPHWDNLPEEDTVGKLCPTVTRRGKAYWRKEATRQLAEEMPEVDWQ